MEYAITEGMAYVTLPPSLSLPRLEAQMSSQQEEMKSLPKREDLARLEVQLEALHRETDTKQQVTEPHL